ncbi:tetratricopeptide repeat protein [Streptomyces sp. NBC_00659]|uniref:tetratricopeptide repeat protein n=1 Tax=Streptomyces sp. NBC_00659 TaxID=2903669 RepID=UPI002E33B6FB|nr:tetratricopeptide repeat protein [Streptomyces sp. NBC_00659]
MTLYVTGRYADAEAEARGVAAAHSRRRGDAWAPIALGIAALATNAQGRHAEALAAYDELLPVFGRTFGAEHVQTLKLRSDRAQALTALGRHAECEAECAAVSQIAARGTGPEMALTAAGARNGLAFALNAQGRHQQAETIIREALADHQASDRFTVVLRLGLARSLNGQARHEEALAEAERVDQLHRALRDELGRSETGAVELALATALLGLGRAAEARPRAAAAHDACLALFGPNHRRTVEAQELLDRIDGI